MLNAADINYEKDIALVKWKFPKIFVNSLNGYCPLIKGI